MIFCECEEILEPLKQLVHLLVVQLDRFLCFLSPLNHFRFYGDPLDVRAEFIQGVPQPLTRLQPEFREQLIVLDPEYLVLPRRPAHIAGPTGQDVHVPPDRGLGVALLVNEVFALANEAQVNAGNRFKRFHPPAFDNRQHRHAR